VTEGAGPVLLAYDGSPSSATAIAAAGRLLPGRRAVVCHVWSGLSRAMFHDEPSALPGVLSEAATELDEPDAAAAEQLAAQGAELARDAGFDAEPLAERQGRKAWRTLLEAAERTGASVVVTGAQGLSGMGRGLLGSVSTAVVHHSPVPVLVVPGTTPEEATDGPVLLSYDGSGPSKRAIAAAGELFGPRDALVLHFWASWVAEAPALAGASTSVQGVAAGLDEVAGEQSGDRVEEGIHVAGEAGFSASGLSERATGPGWKAVLDAADAHSCAAIVVGSRGLTGMSAALGSISNGVVHHGRRPVLVVPWEEER
jgi:nucleotide-binding universal stress UspA family protein